MVTLSFRKIRQAIRHFPLPEADLVIGIATGGVAPATMVAWELECELDMIKINYRGPDNKPVYELPRILSYPDRQLPAHLRILLVDDVAVTGKTLEIAREIFSMHEVKTLVLKGSADYVLFPDIKSCVNWPWKT